MIFKQFEHIVSPKRMERYIIAADKQKRKSKQIYNANLNLAKEVFVVLSFFEVGIDSKALLKGMDYVRDECKEIKKLM